VPVTASKNTYAAWDSSTYATLEAAPSYGVLEGGRLQITRTLPSSGSLLPGHAWAMAFGGTLAPSGNPTKQATHKLLGSLTSSGTVLIGKIFTRSVAGALASSGTLTQTRLLVRALAGTLTPTAALNVRLANRTYFIFGHRLVSFGQLRLEWRHAPWPPLVSEAPTRPPALVGATRSNAPTLTPSAKVSWPPLNPADRVS